MQKKFELALETEKELNGRKMHRVRALISFEQVTKGDLGGYVEEEKNLSHVGTCWVYGDALVYDNAWVCDNAHVYGNALVYDNAHVYGNALVYDNALVYGNAHVYDNALVYGNARVYGNAKVYDNAQVKTTPKCLTGLNHDITITETHIFIGCEGHTIEHWRKEIVNIGKKHNYTADETKQVIGLLKLLVTKEKK